MRAPYLLTLYTSFASLPSHTFRPFGVLVSLPPVPGRGPEFFGSIVFFSGQASLLQVALPSPPLCRCATCFLRVPCPACPLVCPLPLPPSARRCSPQSRPRSFRISRGRAKFRVLVLPRLSAASAPPQLCCPFVLLVPRCVRSPLCSSRLGAPPVWPTSSPCSLSSLAPPALLSPVPSPVVVPLVP